MEKRCFLFIIAALVAAALIAPAVPAQEKEDLFKKARGYFFKKKYEMAETFLKQAIQEDPENALACSYLGDICLLKKDYDNALLYYNRALNIQPRIAENYFRIGQIYYYRKLGKPAIENFQKALELDPGIKFAWYHIGLSWLMLERDKENTIKSWETYLGLAPEDPQYDRIKKVLELLRDPNFKIPAKNSPVSMEEALLLGGATLNTTEQELIDNKAGHESKKTNKKVEEIYLDDDL